MTEMLHGSIHGGKPRFLIDAAIFGGSSGSPVFLLDRRVRQDSAGGATTESRIHLLGIVAAGYYMQDDLRVIERPIPTGNTELVAKSEQMINLGVVFKAQTIKEAAAPFATLG